MEINLNRTGIFTLNVYAKGRLDLDSAVEYGQKITDFIYDSDEEIKELVLDFSEITFISSYGLKVILELYKKMKETEGSLKIKGVSEEIKKSFNLVGFNKFLALD
ncbi:STAS domain-containing protein [bacterium]|nr:STAS domain-containing protein [bacterium]